MKKILDNLKYIKLSDLCSPFIFIIALPFALILKLYNKLKNRKLWLVCEDGESARDNGYFFYKYVRERHPEEHCFYVINKRSNSYEKVKDLGNIIQFKSFKHWVFYLAATWNISNQKNGNPNQPFFYVLHVMLNLFNNRVFLQHGITKDDADWLYYKNTKFRYFICGAKKEYNFIENKFGYPKGFVQYTGFARFDNLFDTSEDKNILFMPTWRNWLGREKNSLGEKTDFIDTDFYKNWNALLTNKDLIKYIESHDIKIKFYPHINMIKYLPYFTSNSKNIEILDTKTDIQKILKESILMVTDYSSVYMDFAYMKKPVVYFQFDKEEYRSRQYKEGYFNYENDGFGPVITDQEEIVKYLKMLDERDYKQEQKYVNRMEDFFAIHDTNNSERIYNLLKWGEDK